MYDGAEMVKWLAKVVSVLYNAIWIMQIRCESITETKIPKSEQSKLNY